jgi:hypothetical protein
MTVTDKEMTQYAFAKLCGVTQEAIYLRVKRQRLILNKKNLVPKGTPITVLKRGAKIKVR